MAILTGDEIVRQRRAGRILIDPFDEARVGPNSVDLTLAADLLVYCRPDSLDMKREPETVALKIPAEGFRMAPGVLYLGATVERCGSSHYVPWIDGRSSVGRLGLSVHVTAGRGDLGFLGRWTLELVSVYPLWIYAGVRIAQVTFFETSGGVTRLYRGRYSDDVAPAPSRLWTDFPTAAKEDETR